MVVSEGFALDPTAKSGKYTSLDNLKLRVRKTFVICLLSSVMMWLMTWLEAPEG